MSIVTINDEHLTDIADAIRRKNGTDNTYTPDKMADAIKDIQGGTEPILEDITVSPKTTEQTITPSDNYDGIGQVKVNAVTSSIDSDIKSSNIKKGVNILGVEGSLVEGITPTGEKEITSNGKHDVVNYASVNVNVTSINPTGTLEVTENGYYDVSNYAGANVNVEGSSGGGDIEEYIITKPTNTKLYLWIKSTPTIDLSNITTSGAGMFENCKYLESLKIVNTSKLTSLSKSFHYCEQLKSIPLFDTSNVTTMADAFKYCYVLESIPAFNTSKVTSMSSTFYQCKKLTSIPSLDTSSVTSMYYMFYGCPQLTDLPLLDCGSCKNVSEMFNGCNKLTNIGGLKDLGKAYSSSNSANYAAYTLSFNSCTPTYDSLLNILNNLYDIASIGVKTQKVVIGVSEIAKLQATEEGQQALALAESKGWTVS